MSKLSIIVAMDKRGGIGINNQPPWHLPEDLVALQKIRLGFPNYHGS